MFEKKLATVGTVISLAIASQSGIFAFAATGESIITAVEKAHILAPGARLNARVDGSTAKISTYRHSKAIDTDMKIDAVLISKTAMELDPSITRVIVYFFNTKDLSHYKQTTVSTGDVKAFATGAVAKDELIASLPIEQLENVDPNSKIESAVLSGFGYRLNTTLDGAHIAVSTGLDPSASDRDLKYVALQIAEKALAAAPKNVSDVKIAFADPDQGGVKQVNLTADAMKGLDDALNSALASISVSETTSGSSKESTESKPDEHKGHGATAGHLRSERQKLLDRIHHLEKTHHEACLSEYQAIEKQIAEGADLSTVEEAVKQLTEKVEQAEKKK